MSDHTTRALDALAVPHGKWTPETWVNDDGYWVARGPMHKLGEPVQRDGESDDDFCERLSESDDEPGGPSSRLAQADAEYASLAVNLAPAMSAVVRAAAEVRDRFEGLGTGSKGALAEWFKARNRLFAAIDAFEAKAKEST